MGTDAIEGRDELLQRYRAGERDFTGTELDKQVLNLRDAILEGADFSRSFITADFAGANLKYVLFVNANLKTCDFSTADLRNAIFSGAALDATTFAGANLQGAEFEGAYCYSRMLSAGEKPWW